MPNLTDSRIHHYLSLAKNACYYSDNTKARLGSVLIYKGKVVSVGWNFQNKTAPLQKELNRLRGWNPDNSTAHNTLHAEMSCLLRARSLDIDWSKASLFTYRIKKNETQGLSKSCPACRAYAKALGIKNLYYSTDDGWGYERID